MDDFFSNLQTAVGPTAAIVLVAVAVILGIFWRVWGEARFRSAAEAAGRIGADKQLREFQKMIDIEIGEAKHRLEMDTEFARADFQKHLSSFGVYAQRRLEAVSAMVSAFLAAEELAIDEPEELQFVPNGTGIHGDQYREWRSRNAYKAWNQAAQAYRGGALYLSEQLRIEATHATNCLLRFAQAQQNDTTDPHARRGEAEDALNAAMRQLILRAQSELRDPESNGIAQIRVTRPSGNPQLPVLGK